MFEKQSWIDMDLKHVNVSEYITAMIKKQVQFLHAF